MLPSSIYLCMKRITRHMFAISWEKIKNQLIKIIDFLPKPRGIEYGRNLRDFFLIFFSLCAAVVIGRFFSAQKINTLVYFQHQLHGIETEGSILISFIGNISSVIAFAFSIIIALWFASWIKNNCSKKFWFVIFRDVPITLLISFSPFCSFWIGTCIVSGLDAHFLAIVNSVAPALAWWNSSYLFIYFQVTLTFIIFHYLSFKTSVVAFVYYNTISFFFRRNLHHSVCFPIG